MATRARSFARLLRRLVVAAISVLSLVVIVLVALILVGRSSWGRQRILGTVLPLVEKQLAGQLRIGALDGDFTHMLVLRDVELRDVEGQLAARLPYVGLRYNLLALAGSTLHVTAVDVRAAEVSARVMKDGRLNLAALVRPSPEESPPSREPLPIRVIVSGIDAEVRAGFDGGPSAGPLQRAAATLRLRGGLHLRPDRSLSVDLDELAVAASAPLAATLGLRGKVALALPDAAKSLTLQDVELGAKVDGSELSRVVAPAGLRGPLALSAKLDGSLTALVARLTLALPQGQAELLAKLGLLDEKLPWQLALSLKAVDPAALYARLPASQIDLSLRGSGQGAGGRLTLESLSVRTAKNSLRLSGSAEAASAAQLLSDPLAAQAELALELAAGDLSELAQLGLGAGMPELGGALHGKVRVALQHRVVRLFTSLQGRELRGPGVALGRLALDADTSDLAGKLRLSVDELFAAGQKLARLSITADGDRRLVRLNVDGEGPDAVLLKVAAQARPQLEGGGGLFALQGAHLTGLLASLDALELQRAGVRLQITQPAELRLAQLHAAPTAQVSGLSLALGSLKLKLDGRYETQGQRLRASVDAAGIDVQELLRIAIGAAAAPQSQLALHAELGGSVAAPEGELRLSGPIEPLPGLLPWRVTPDLSVKLGNRRVRGELTLRTESAQKEGGPHLHAHFDAPVARQGAVELTLEAKSALQALRDFLPQPLQDLSGALAAQVNIGGTLHKPRAAIKVTLPSWELSPLRGAETALTVTYEAEKLAAKLAAQLLEKGGPPLGRAELDAQLPLRLGVDVSGAAVVEQLRSSAGQVALSLRELSLPRLLAVAQGAARKPPLAAGVAELAVTARGPLLTPR